VDTSLTSGARPDATDGLRILTTLSLTSGARPDATDDLRILTTLSLTSGARPDATDDLRIPATVFSQAGRNDGAFRHAGLDKPALYLIRGHPEKKRGQATFCLGLGKNQAVPVDSDFRPGLSTLDLGRWTGSILLTTHCLISMSPFR